MSIKPFLIAAVVWLGVASAAPAEEQMRGVVVKVDTGSGELTVEARGIGVRGNVLTFTIGKDASIVIGRQAAGLKDVAVGRHVQVTYQAQDKSKVAVAVHVNGLMLPPLGGQPAAGQPAGPAVAAKDGNSISGKLRRIALTEREIVVAVAGSGADETYVSLPVAADAKISRDDKPIQFDDLKEEEPAVVRFEMRNGKKVATAVLTGKVTSEKPADKPTEASKIARLRQLLKIADAVLDLVDKK